MNYFCSSGHERRFSIFLECNSKDAVAGKLCKSMSPLVWTSVSRVGAVGCTADFAGAKLTIAVSPSLPSFLFYFFFLPSLCAFPPPSVLLPSFSLPPGVLLPLYPSLLSPAQCAIRWVRLHWDAEQLSESLQLQPVSGLEGQESVFRRQ